MRLEVQQLLGPGDVGYRLPNVTCARGFSFRIASGSGNFGDALPETIYGDGIAGANIENRAANIFPAGS
jgi:hypothetical protein